MTAGLALVPFPGYRSVTELVRATLHEGDNQVRRSVKYGLYGAVLAGVTVAATAAFAAPGATSRSITLVVDGKTSQLSTTASNVAGALQAAGYRVAPTTSSRPPPTTALTNGETIVLRRGRLLHLIRRRRAEGGLDDRADGRAGAVRARATPQPTTCRCRARSACRSARPTSSCARPSRCRSSTTARSSASSRLMPPSPRCCAT